MKNNYLQDASVIFTLPSQKTQGEYYYGAGVFQ